MNLSESNNLSADTFRRRLQLLISMVPKIVQDSPKPKGMPMVSAILPMVPALVKLIDLQLRKIDSTRMQQLLIFTQNIVQCAQDASITDEQFLAMVRGYVESGEASEADRA